MRLIRLLIVLSVIPIIMDNAQNKLTLDEAVNMAYKNSIELQRQSSSIRNAEIILDESKRLPNPKFSYSSENLKSNSIDYSEWIASGSIPINFLWDRWSNLESKENLLEAEKQLFNKKKIDLASDVKVNFISFYSFSSLSVKLNKPLTSLHELTESAKLRMNEGDISEYELQRILVELNKLKVTTKEVELEKNKYKNNLKLLIGSDIADTIIPHWNQINVDINQTKEELINIALENRNDLSSISIMMEGEKLSLSNNKLKSIPNINLSAGYKKQLDNFEGAVYQIDFELPLFNRNQTAIQESENTLSLLERERQFLQGKIKIEVSETYEQLVMNTKLLKGQGEIQLDNLFETALYSYKYGELTLVELLDGINAFIEGSKTANDIEINQMRSIFELEKLVGTTITNIE